MKRLKAEDEFSKVARSNNAIAGTVENLLKSTARHDKEFVELANSLRGLLGEVRKTICYFQDPESFDVEYAQFVKSSGRPAASKEIMIDTWVLPLYGLYLEVISVGGFVQVTHDMGWERVFRRLSPSSKAGMANTQNAPFTFALESALKEAYLLYLYPYEYSRRLEWVGKDL